MSRLVAIFLLAVLAAWSPARAADGVTVRNPWARASTGDHQEAALYFTIVNRTGETARLTAAKTYRASMALFLRPDRAHGGLEQLRIVEVPPGDTLTLGPGGLHVVLSGLQRPLEADHDLEVELFFDQLGAVRIEVPIATADALSPPRRKRH